MKKGFLSFQISEFRTEVLLPNLYMANWRTVCPIDDRAFSIKEEGGEDTSGCDWNNKTIKVMNILFNYKNSWNQMITFLNIFDRFLLKLLDFFIIYLLKIELISG